MAHLTDHLGRPRDELGLPTNEKRGMEDEFPRFNIVSNVVLRKKLQQLVEACPYREDTGKVTDAPCCRSEGGKVYKCNLYGAEPAKMYDCLVCKKNEEIKRRAEWIMPFVRLQQGSVLSFSSLEEALQRLSVDS